MTTGDPTTTTTTDIFININNNIEASPARPTAVSSAAVESPQPIPIWRQPEYLLETDDTESTESW